MNKKVFVCMLVLCVAFLVGLYIAKIFFPQDFVMVIENEQLIKIGDFIDNNAWLYYICSGITAFVTYWLYLCAVSHRKYLNWEECLIVVATIVVIRLCGLYVDETLRTIISTTSFVFLPAIMKGNIKSCAVVFTTHSLAQAFSLMIRDLPLYFTNSINFLTTLFMTFECYIWLILFYIIFNYKKEKDMNIQLFGEACPPWYGKSKFYEKKKAKALKKIEKLNNVIAECDKELAKNEKKD